MNNPSRLIVLLTNALLSAAMIFAYAAWIAPSRTPRLAVLDVAELYRLKETQVAAMLVKPDGTEVDRAAIMKGVQGFGAEVMRVVQALPQECRCLILARGALIGEDSHLRDLTAEARRRLGL